MPSLHKAPLCCFVSDNIICRDTWHHGTWYHDSHLATNIVVCFNAGRSLAHSSPDSFFTHFMKWHCSLQPKLTSHKEKEVQRFEELFFASMTNAVPPPYFKIGLDSATSYTLPGNLWTVSVTFWALSSKCLFIGGEAGTEKQHLSQAHGLGQWRSWDILLPGGTTSTHPLWSFHHLRHCQGLFKFCSTTPGNLVPRQFKDLH